MLNDITRCMGRDCHQRQHCARYTAPVPEGVLLSWASTMNPEGAPECPEIIYNIKKDD